MTMLLELLRAILRPVLMPLLKWYLARRSADFEEKYASAMAWQMFANEMFHMRYQA
jgi:hypothetical protein